MLTPSPSGSPPPTCLQFLLFVDEGPNSQENVKVICSYLEQVRDTLPFELQVLEIHEHPHLVEHFRLVATPSLVKVFPEPRQTLAGSNIVQQLAKWWPRWEKEWQTLALPHRAEVLAPSCPREISGVGYSGELMKMADELFQLRQERA